MSILSLKDISKKYNAKIALDDINLSLDKNEIIGIVGPNGAGKTTLFRIIMGLIEPTVGEVRLWGEKLDSCDIGKKISYCSDGDNLYEDLTVKENLEFIARCYSIKDSDKKIEHLSMLFDIHKELDNETKNLSKGMKKKVALIRSIITCSPIIIMDEPMNWLDLENQRKLNNVLIKLSSKSLIIISSHNLSLIENICDKVIILNQNLKYFGDVKDINADSIIKLEVVCDNSNFDINVIKDLDNIEGVLKAELEKNILFIEFDNKISNVENNIISCIINKYNINIHEINRIEKKLEDLYFEKVR